MRWVQFHRTGQKKIRLRHGERGDAQSSLELFRSIVAEEEFFVLSASEFHRTLLEKEQQIHHHCIQPQSCIFMAHAQETLVGQAALLGGGLLRNRHVAELEMFISKGYRGCGLGKALLNMLIEWAKQHSQLKKISLSVFLDNKAAISLYKGCGFVEEGVLKGAFREVDNRMRDQVLMALFL